MLHRSERYPLTPPRVVVALIIMVIEVVVVAVIIMVLEAGVVEWYQ